MKTDKMKKVLIALDYNPTAQKVAESGYSIAKAMNAEVILLHVISDQVYYSSMEYSPIMGFTGYMDSNLWQLNNVDSLKDASDESLEMFSRNIDQMENSLDEMQEKNRQDIDTLLAETIVMMDTLQGPGLMQYLVQRFGELKVSSDK